MKTISVLDSTLRDGAQAKGISFSVEDKLKIAHTLDELGVHYVEAGNPGSNPKDLEFFKRMEKQPLKTARLAAFGSTRRPKIAPAEDHNLNALLSANTPVTVIFGKSWDFHVTEILNTTLSENLRMIEDTVRFLKQNGKEVIFDAEHFFDGYRANKSYALATLLATQQGGADSVCLCETNGGAFFDEVEAATRAAVLLLHIPVGIHTHNDGGMAVANTLAAVKAGARAVQGTLCGFGERCGNANLSTIIANLQLKKGCSVIPEENMESLTELTRRVAEIANLSLSGTMPYVGKYAFTHKAGMHIDGVTKCAQSFEHVPPHSVGNERKFLMSEVAGRSTVAQKVQKIDPSIGKDSPITKRVIDKVKELEHQGYQFEGAQSAFELLIMKETGKYKPFFELETFKVIGEQPFEEGQKSTSVVMKIKVDGKVEMTASEGDGPVNALDRALRKALEVFYPSLKNVHLSDYKVRVLDSNLATASKVRVLIESTDGEHFWTTVGVSTDIIEASWIALVDSIEYKLLKEQQK